MISFEEALTVTTDPFYIIGLVIIWLLPLLIYIILGLTVKGKYGKYMASYPNYYYAIIIWGLVQLALIIMLVLFPIQYKVI